MPLDPHPASIWESVADAIPDEVAVVQGARRVTWRTYEERASRFAAALGEAGVGEGDKVALLMFNCPEYLEAHFGALKARAVPVNVNYRYVEDELLYVLRNCEARAVVHHSSLRERVDRIRHLVADVRLWVEVDDGAVRDKASAIDSSGYEELLATCSPADRIRRSGSDVYLLYTGGTTGMPKGVMYDADTFTRRWMTAISRFLGDTGDIDLGWAARTARERADAGIQAAWLTPCPLMHASGMWLGAVMPHMAGGRAVLLEGRSFDPTELWSAVASERADTIVIVGDPFARPMVRALDQALADGIPFDVSSVRRVMSSGAMLASETKARLLESFPAEATVFDGFGSTEGSIGKSTVRRGDSDETARFEPEPGTKVFTEDDREVVPGSGERGLVAVGGWVPLGYFKDPEGTARTFRVINGQRYAIPGDWATVDADGTLLVLGRGSTCINTGGEKVFPEEVEEVLKRHALVDDCLVIGVDDPEYGSRVAAVVAVRTADPVGPDELVAWAKERLAGYKVPRQILVGADVPRMPNGKADYDEARRRVALATLGSCRRLCMRRPTRASTRASISAVGTSSSRLAALRIRL
jgi:fatty-acyl-CoA synthase